MAGEKNPKKGKSARTDKLGIIGYEGIGEVTRSSAQASEGDADPQAIKDKSDAGGKTSKRRVSFSPDSVRAHVPMHFPKVSEPRPREQSPGVRQAPVTRVPPAPVSGKSYTVWGALMENARRLFREFPGRTIRDFLEVVRRFLG
jgi:hypothetical protein